MSQNRYPPYTTYDAYFNAPPRAFEKQLEPGMQAILDSRHPMPRPFDTYTYPGYEGSFQTTSPAIDQGLQALLSGNKPHASARDTYSNPIASFYHDADGPWNSVRATSQARGSAANPTLTVPNLDYNSYRDAPASEISDSGYASQAAASQSIVNTNTEPTDYNRECGDLPVQVNSFSFTPTTHSSPAYGSPSFQTRNPDRTGIRPQSQNTLTCSRCGDVAKCRSDFKCVQPLCAVGSISAYPHDAGSTNSSTRNHGSAMCPTALARRASLLSMISKGTKRACTGWAA